MTHDELQNKFILWFQKNFPDARIFENHSGKARINKNLWIPYGFPSTGGGSDLIALYPGAHTVFYEIKTNAYPKLSMDQIRWAELVLSLGFGYFVVRETAEEFKIYSFNKYQKKLNNRKK